MAGWAIALLAGQLTLCSDATSGWTGLAFGPGPPGILEFSSPYSNLGADYTHDITACPPGFGNLAASLLCQPEGADCAPHIDICPLSFW